MCSRNGWGVGMDVSYAKLLPNPVLIQGKHFRAFSGVFILRVHVYMYRCDRTLIVSSMGTDV